MHARIRSRAVSLARRLGLTEWGAALPLLLVWLGAMLATPFVEVGVGPAGFASWIGLTVLLQAAMVVALLLPALGRRATLRLVAIVALVAFAAEAVGAATDLPFGAYAYTDLLQPQLLGVPVLIPLAWLMLLPSSWVVASLLTGRAGGALHALVAGVALTAWDLFLDPQMVLWGLWRWDEPGAYFGIPLVNFAGWILVGALITILVGPVTARSLPRRPLLGLYSLVALIEVGGLVTFWDLPGPALVGLVAMGSLALASWARLEAPALRRPTAAPLVAEP